MNQQEQQESTCVQNKSTQVNKSKKVKKSTDVSLQVNESLIIYVSNLNLRVYNKLQKYLT